jgi:alkyl sulfatase BDS1-like metallo-beta-lactamase superfamily hydrolase
MRKLSASLLCLLATSQAVYAETIEQQSQPTTYTVQANQQFAKNLPFSDIQDYTNAQKGFIAKPASLVIKDDKGNVVWDFTPYPKFEALNTPTPDTVNPSLWRQSQLNALYGLFEVEDGIYQVRGYDISNMTIIRGKSGYIVVDPLISKETAQAAMELFYQHFPKKPVVAVIYTHSHIDHFGGVKGVVSLDDVEHKKVKIIAPEGFMSAAISENVLAGNAMSRRAMYMYGSLLPQNAQGIVDTGLGKGTSAGTGTLIDPTTTINHTGQELVVDGIKFIFQYTPGTEAPSEMNFYLPDYKALCMAENTTRTMHNLYTLRGAQVRDAQAWSKDITETIKLFGDKTNVIFASHGWPTWGQQQAIDYLEKQGDVYKYIHDQTLRLANEGFTMNEIADMVQLPPSLENEWYDRGYYGTVSHNVKAVYQKYLGWYDGNPAHLNPLPPVEESKKMVEYMGGEDAIIKKAQQDYDNGNYRWVAEVMNYVVFADPTNQKAKDLEASAFEQLGYQAESAPWRNIYLTGAQELRQGVKPVAAEATASADIIKAMPLHMVFDYLAIRLNGPKANGKEISMNIVFPDIHEEYNLQVKNSVLNYYEGVQDPNAGVTLTMDKRTMDALTLGQITVKQAYKDGKIKLEGNKEELIELFSLFDKFNLWFNIVTP